MYVCGVIINLFSRETVSRFVLFFNHARFKRRQQRLVNPALPPVNCCGESCLAAAAAVEVTRLRSFVRIENLIKTFYCSHVSRLNHSFVAPRSCVLAVSRRFKCNSCNSIQ